MYVRALRSAVQCSAEPKRDEMSLRDSALAISHLAGAVVVVRRLPPPPFWSPVSEREVGEGWNEAESSRTTPRDACAAPRRLDFRSLPVGIEFRTVVPSREWDLCGRRAMAAGKGHGVDLLVARGRDGNGEGWFSSGSGGGIRNQKCWRGGRIRGASWHLPFWDAFAIWAMRACKDEGSSGLVLGKE